MKDKPNDKKMFVCCTLCGRMDCDCEDVLTEEEYKKLVEESKRG
jgi:hypothetical protein